MLRRPRDGREMMFTMNQKYEITDIAQEKHSFLHRIRALRDIGKKVKAGELGGFVESERNLSFEAGDDAWIFGCAIACNDAYVDKGSALLGESVVCGNAYVSQNSALSGHARAEDDAYIRGSNLCGHARVSGCGMVLDSPDTGCAPILSGTCAVYGRVCGDVHLTNTALIISGEEICNDSLDTLVMDGKGRSVIRDPSRDELAPQKLEPQKKKSKKKGMER